MTEHRKISDAIGNRLKELRGDTSVRKLVEKARAGGFSITANVIENIEGVRRGENRPRRSVSVDEWLALAYALDVSPLALLLPAEETTYDLTTTASVPVVEVYRWIVGQREHRPSTSDTPPPLTAEEEEAAWVVLRRHLPWLPKSPHLENLIKTRQALSRLTEPDDEIDPDR